MAWPWRHTPQTVHLVDDWITRELTQRGLTPAHCTPDALARALERERHITIEFRPHVSDDPGVYGLLYRPEERTDTYIILFRPTRNLALHRLILFHELAHILFHHALTEVEGVGGLRGYMITSADDAMAEAFAVGAMQYSFLHDEAVPLSGSAESPPSHFGQFLRRTQYQP